MAALAVVTWAVTKQGVNRQSEALLKNNAGQIQLLLQSALTTVQGQLRAAAFITSTSGNSATVLEQQSAALRAQPGVSVALVDTSGATPRVVVAVGSDFQPGETLPPALADVARAGSTTLAGSVLQVGGVKRFALAAAPSILPHAVALETSPVVAPRATPNRSGPYAKVYVNIYGSSQARADQLLITTYGPNPLPKPVATALLSVGAVHWLIAVAPKDPLIGGAAAAAPWIILGIILFIAVLLGVFVEVLVRRQHYARELVEERTAELVATQRTLVRQERLAAIGEMASVVSHELRNPLSAVINDLFLVRRRAESGLGDASERHLSNAEREVYRAARLSEDLLAYAREREPQLAEVDLGSLVTEVLETTPAPAQVTVEVDAPVQFEADPVLMAQVLSNLITNAVQAMPDGGPLRISARRDNGATVIAVEDSGPGVDPAVTQRLFEPFFTTKEGGTGLGLAIVQRLVEAHGGQVGIENVPAGGARVSIRIPSRSPAS